MKNVKAAREAMAKKPTLFIAVNKNSEKSVNADLFLSRLAEAKSAP
ncbi:hypothetical protein GWO43_06105 [candidate division KSB1 bacterium]|nr:hypothetical protein [candidate division KSB1 bacterium]NIS23531.1 hypothetical protein [candidate division KSB1 bacterium]NIT70461.1 hypothetical protein [candidate division KSB1 bacterium]NIU24158.1 hypothetical protein [candidate division KSB1 bacterium]NIU93412.1 hypothetical protein [candidate division KSB1 bacterium]